MSHLHSLHVKHPSLYISLQNRARDCIAAGGSVFEAARRHRPRLDNEGMELLEAEEEEREEERPRARLTRSQRAVFRNAVRQHNLA